MTMCYDIDISYIYAPEVFDDPAKGALLRRNGMQPHSRANYVAKFRDPRTARALAEAPEAVRAYFQDCGFAFVASGVSLPSGSIDYTFGNHLKDVAVRMQENLSVYDISEVPLNGLDIAACIKAIGDVRMVDSTALRSGHGFWLNLLRPTLALPALALGVVVTLHTFGGTQDPSTSSSLIDADVTRLMPAGR